MTFRPPRDAFPGLAQVAYLNTGFYGPLPRRALDAMTAAMEDEVARGRVRPSYEAGIYELRAAIRKKLANVLSAGFRRHRAHALDDRRHDLAGPRARPRPGRRDRDQRGGTSRLSPATITKLMRFTNDDPVEVAARAVYGGNPPPRAAVNSRLNRRWWVHLLLKNPNPFQERLAWFLHDHFATSDVGFASDAQWFLYDQVQLFRRFSLPTTDATEDGHPGLGFDWEKICIEMGKNRAMLEWLDGRVSRVGAPNENYARELWELFMLGEGNGYTEEDIQEASRAFTGFEWWRDRALHGAARQTGSRCAIAPAATMRARRRSSA